MEKHFDQELAALKKELLKMGALVEQAISESVEALKALNEERAQNIIVQDKIIDELENEIDEQCLDLLALHQPMAGDLRFITMVMGITTDLERMADLSVDIAQRVLELAGKPLLKPLVDIPLLANVAKQMTKEALDSFINRDVNLALRVMKSDGEADRLRDLVQKELQEDYMLKDPSSTPRAIPLLLVARHLERICDHATNIAEHVIYMVEGRVVKHHLKSFKYGNK